VAGERDKAQKILDDLIEQQMERYVSPYDIARMYIGLDDKDEALNWLMTSLEHRTGWLAYLNVDHHFIFSPSIQPHSMMFSSGYLAIIFTSDLSLEA
jgi:hypothetical protein